MLEFQTGSEGVQYNLELATPACSILTFYVTFRFEEEKTKNQTLKVISDFVI